MPREARRVPYIPVCVQPVRPAFDHRPAPRPELLSGHPGERARGRPLGRASGGGHLPHARCRPSPARHRQQAAIPVAGGVLHVLRSPALRHPAAVRPSLQARPPPLARRAGTGCPWPRSAAAERSRRRREAWPLAPRPPSGAPEHPPRVPPRLRAGDAVAGSRYRPLRPSADRWLPARPGDASTPRPGPGRGPGLRATLARPVAPHPCTA